jgi:hypothetical protein
MNEELTMVTVIGVLLLLGQILQLYNTAVTAKKNANEPMRIVKEEIAVQGKRIGEIEHEVTDMKKDINNAFDKIRENKEESERTSKAQNAALVQILLLLKEPTNKNDAKIDETIKQLTSI